MVNPSNIDSGLTQSQWINACRKLGLIVDTSRGNGSHARAYFGSDASVPPMTIQCHMNKIISQKIYKNLLKLGFTEKQIDKALK